MAFRTGNIARGALVLLCVQLFAAGTAAAQGCVERWASLSGLAGTVNGLAVYDDGGGPRLYIGGDRLVWNSGGPASLVRWDGATFQPVSITDPGTPVYSLHVFQIGSSTRLYAGRLFAVDSLSAGAWTSVPVFLSGAIRSMALFDDGGGPSVFAASERNVAKLASASATTIGVFVNGAIGPARLLAYDDGIGPALYFAGEFNRVTSSVPPPSRTVFASGIARWRPATGWEPLTDDIFTGGCYLFTSPLVSALATFDDGSGTKLYAGGLFCALGGASERPTGPVVVWDGHSLTPVGRVRSNRQFVEALRVFDAGDGPRLYAAGHESPSLPQPSFAVMRWDGDAWSPAGGNLRTTGSSASSITALAEYDAGTGRRLFAGGSFRNPSGPGDVALARFGCFCGDVTGDGIVDGDDVDVVVFASGTAAADINGDGTTNEADLEIVAATLGRTCP